jgi:hypothetical protein
MDFAEDFNGEEERQMKKYAWIAGFILLALSAACLIYVPNDEDGRPVPRGQTYDRDYGSGGLDEEYFYEYLSSFGNWVNNTPYGYVWVPRHMRHSWRPYTSGRWVWTDYGWTWVSSFEWGWVPFHYGRWGWDRDLGWFWVPDTVWGPAWVTWRAGDFYMGWAPLPPEAEFIPGLGIRSFDFDFPPHYWIFVNTRHFMLDRLDRYVLPFERNYTIIDFTMINGGIHVRGGRVFNEGIDVERVRRFTRQDVTRFELRDPNRPGPSRIEGGNVFLHKPSISKNQLASPKTYLSRDEAGKKIPMEEIEDEATGGTGLRDDQEREKRLLEESQEIEVNEIRRKVEDDKKLARTLEGKEKVEEEYKAKVTALRKKHETEKSELGRRHKEEEDKVKRSKIRKKD